MPEYIKIRTARNVEIEYQIASLGDRIFGRVIDSIIQIGYVFIIMALTGLTQTMFLFYFLLIPAFFYSFLFERFNNGQTPGKSIMQTRVVALSGEGVTTGMFLQRWAMLLVDSRLVSGAIGMLSILISENGQRLGDLMANTTVISLKKRASLQKSPFRRIPKNYIPTYQEVNMMNDNEMQILKKVVRSKSENKHHLVMLAAEKMEEVYGIEKNASSLSFLQTIIKDYNYYQHVAHKDELGSYDDEEEEFLV